MLFRGMGRFLRGLFRQPYRVQLWVGVLVAVNGLIPLAYLGRVEARVSIGLLMAGGVLMALLTARSGFTRLLGLGHILWIPFVAWMVLRLPTIAGDGGFPLWARAVIAVNSLSLVIDATDVIRYLRGERAETVVLD